MKTLASARMILCLAVVSISSISVAVPQPPDALPSISSETGATTEPTSPPTSDSFELAWKWAKGSRKFRTTVETLVLMGRTGEPGTLMLENKVITDSVIEVNEVASDGTASATLTYIRMRCHGRGQGVAFEFDSDQPELSRLDKGRSTDPEIEDLRPLLHQPIRFKVSKLGLISDVSGASALAERLAAAVSSDPSTPPDQAHSQVKRAQSRIREQVSDANVQIQLESMFYILPPSSVHAKDSWSRPQKQRWDSSRIMSGTVTFTLAEVAVKNGQHVSTITTMSTLKPTAPDPASQTTSPFESAGTMIFAIDSGVLLETTSDGTLTVTYQGPSSSENTAPARPSVVTTVTKKTRLEPITE